VTAWNVGAAIGAAFALGVVYLNAVGVIGWPWLAATSPMVIAGGACGAYIGRKAEAP
jgi:uncharacterized membrane protein YfcA